MTDLQKVAWDAMSQLSFGETLGILEAGNDHGKILESSVRSVTYFGPVMLSGCIGGG